MIPASSHKVVGLTLARSRMTIKLALPKCLLHTLSFKPFAMYPARSEYNRACSALIFTIPKTCNTSRNFKLCTRE